MKLNIASLFILLGAAANSALAGTEANATLNAKIAECGDIDNVMPVPQGAAATAEYRTCLEHPLGRAGPSDGDSLSKRACWTGKVAGCTGGYCWKRCGNDLAQGHWCWTAIGGTGDWYKCSADEQCHEYMPCGEGSGCASCGCSC
ncbi:putative IDI-2 precursor [Rosellinia necatrix]|uniref:Putative IDI-2 n=1 Tax=Rosellinia necatrix TaxID=77044 RepID=A0A1S7UNS6_ROSNE|nr:putative IDI-2 precursor [Rosellinia necatrix]